PALARIELVVRVGMQGDHVVPGRRLQEDQVGPRSEQLPHAERLLIEVQRPVQVAHGEMDVRQAAGVDHSAPPPSLEASIRRWLLPPTRGGGGAGGTPPNPPPPGAPLLDPEGGGDVGNTPQPPRPESAPGPRSCRPLDWRLATRYNVVGPWRLVLQSRRGRPTAARQSPPVKRAEGGQRWRRSPSEPRRRGATQTASGRGCRRAWCTRAARR